MLNKIFLFMRWYEDWVDIETATKLSSGRRFETLYFSVHHGRAYSAWNLKNSISFSIQYHDHKDKADKITYYFIDYKEIKTLYRKDNCI